MVEVKLANPVELQEQVDLAQKAYRRTFDSELHECTICQREVLGEKFVFLTGCEHYFCHECMKDFVVQKI